MITLQEATAEQLLEEFATRVTTALVIYIHTPPGGEDENMLTRLFGCPYQALGAVTIARQSLVRTIMAEGDEGGDDYNEFQEPGFE